MEERLFDLMMAAGDVYRDTVNNHCGAREQEMFMDAWYALCKVARKYDILKDYGTYCDAVNLGMKERKIR